MREYRTLIVQVALIIQTLGLPTAKASSDQLTSALQSFSSTYYRAQSYGELVAVLKTSLGEPNWLYLKSKVAASAHRRLPTLSIHEHAISFNEKPPIKLDFKNITKLEFTIDSVSLQCARLNMRECFGQYERKLAKTSRFTWIPRADAQADMALRFAGVGIAMAAAYVVNQSYTLAMNPSCESQIKEWRKILSANSLKLISACRGGTDGMELSRRGENTVHNIKILLNGFRDYSEEGAQDHIYHDEQLSYIETRNRNLMPMSTISRKKDAAQVISIENRVRPYRALTSYARENNSCLKCAEELNQALKGKDLWPSHLNEDPQVSELPGGQ